MVRVVRDFVTFLVLQVTWACHCGTSWFLLYIFLLNSLLISYSQILLRKTSHASRGSFPGVRFLCPASLCLPFRAAWLQAVRLGGRKAALLPRPRTTLNICGRWSKVPSGLQITTFLFLPSVLAPHLTASG